MLVFCVAVLILKMEEHMQHFQYIMLYYFKKGKKATEMQKRCMTDRTCQKWFTRFCVGDFSLMTFHGQLDNDQVKTLRM